MIYELTKQQIVSLQNILMNYYNGRLSIAAEAGEIQQLSQALKLKAEVPEPEPELEPVPVPVPKEPEPKEKK